MDKVLKKKEKLLELEPMMMHQPVMLEMMKPGETMTSSRPMGRKQKQEMTKQKRRDRGTVEMRTSKIMMKKQQEQEGKLMSQNQKGSRAAPKEQEEDKVWLIGIRVKGLGRN
jgi:GTP cyclohydrolase FolE2